MPNQTTLTTFESTLPDQMRINTNYESMEEESHLPQPFTVDQKQIALFTTNLEGLITHWTIGISRLFQYSTTEILGKDISILFENMNHRTFLGLVTILLNNGRNLSKKQKIKRKNGDIFYVDFCHSPLRDKGGNIIGLIHVCRTTLQD